VRLKRPAYFRNATASLVVALACAGLNKPTTSWATETQVRDFISDGLNSFSAGDVRGAIADYSSALAIEGTGKATTAQRAAAHSHRGQAYFRIDRFTEARDDFIEALDARADLHGYVNRFDTAADLGRLGDAYFSLGVFNQAIDDGYLAAISAVDDTVNTAEMRFKRGVAFYNLGQFENAVQDFTYVISLGTFFDNGTNSFVLTDPFEQSLLNRGRAYHQMQNYDHAFADLTQLIDRRRDIAGYVDRAAVLAKTGLLTQAQADLRVALQYDPTRAGWLEGLSCLAGSAGISNCTSIAIPSQIPQPVFLAFHPGQEPHNVNVDGFTFALRRDPKNLDALIGLGDTHFARGQYNNASERYQQALALDPNAVAALLGGARASVENGQWQTAIALYARLEAVLQNSDPLLARVHYERGLSYQKLQESEGARADFATAFDLDPSLLYAGYLAETQ
jgi:tetratricopeptide (TPR) repeat protein